MGRPSRAALERRTMAEDLSDSLFELVLDKRRLSWPSREFRDDPIGFFERILGIKPWSKQREVLESVRDNPRTTVKSGHRVSKSNTGGGAGLWFYACHEDARVLMTAPSMHQVEDILWRETKMLYKRAGTCVECKAKAARDGTPVDRPCQHSALLDGELAERAKTGLRSPDFREIKAVTAKEVEQITGLAGRNLMFIVDEASGVADEIFEGLEGNRAGGAADGDDRVRELYLSNPTRTTGHFYLSHTKLADFYHCVTISSEESPNVVAKRVVVPGLATLDWVEEKKRMWGEQSALYLIRVKGEFAESEDGRIFSVHTIAEAEERWHEVKAEGRLYIGIDAAGESGTGDEAILAPRRGLKLLELEAHQGLSPAAHLVHLLAMIDRLRLPRETPVVVLDGEGAVGARVLGELQRYLDGEKVKPFELVVIRASNQAVRQPRVYDRMRDELTANLEGWIRDGGAIVEDAKLAAEMHAFEWEEQARTGKLKLIPPKKQLRRQPPNGLGRSPDRYDALTLSCWEPLALRDPGRLKREKTDDEDFAEAVMDPYSGGSAWKR